MTNYHNTSNLPQQLDLPQELDLPQREKLLQRNNYYIGLIYLIGLITTAKVTFYRNMIFLLESVLYHIILLFGYMW